MVPFLGVSEVLDFTSFHTALRQSDHAVYAIDSSHVGIVLPELPPRVFEFDSVFRPDCPQLLGPLGPLGVRLESERWKVLTVLASPKAPINIHQPPTIEDLATECNGEQHSTGTTPWLPWLNLSPEASDGGDF